MPTYFGQPRSPEQRLERAVDDVLRIERRKPRALCSTTEEVTAEQTLQAIAA